MYISMFHACRHGEQRNFLRILGDMVGVGELVEISDGQKIANMKKIDSIGIDLSTFHV